MNRTVPRYQLYSLVGRTTGTSSLTRPVIMTGTGRCGSSLLTDILNTHSEVAGFPTEANELWHPHSFPFHLASIDSPELHEDPKTFTELSLSHWPARHADYIQQVFRGFQTVKGRGKVFFVKSAMIAFMLPKLFSMFPEARFVHIYRSGPSVVESMVTRGTIKNEANQVKPPDAKYRADCARYWNDCVVEVERARKDLRLVEQGKFLEFSYEALCQDAKGMVNQLADYVGIDRNGFAYDLSKVRSTNDKVGAYAQDPEWQPLLELMRPAMTLKGYWPA
jgi:LPS sulfotransferase NodH